MKILFAVMVVIFVTSNAGAGDIQKTPHAKKTLEIYKKIISIPTVKGRGRVPEMVNYLVSELKAAGFSDQDIHILPKGKTAALDKAVHSRYPGLAIMGYMEPGGTDGMHYRAAGIPTVAISSIFMDPDNMFAHGLNERLPIKAFYDGLDYWTVILKELAGR